MKVPSKIEDHGDKMAKMSKAQEESNIEEAQTNAKESENEEINTGDMFIHPNEDNFRNNNPRTLNEKL